MWRWFTSPRRRFDRELSAQHEDIGRAYVAHLRASIAQRDHDPAAVALVADLRSASVEFSRMWDEHRVHRPPFAIRSIRDERAGHLDFNCAVVMSSLSRQRLAILEAMAGTATRQRLTRLGTPRRHDDIHVSAVRG